MHEFLQMAGIVFVIDGVLVTIAILAAINLGWLPGVKVSFSRVFASTRIADSWEVWPVPNVSSGGTTQYSLGKVTVTVAVAVPFALSVVDTRQVADRTTGSDHQWNSEPQFAVKSGNSVPKMIQIQFPGGVVQGG